MAQETGGDSVRVVDADSTFQSVEPGTTIQFSSETKVHFIDDRGFGNVLRKLEKARTREALETVREKLRYKRDTLSDVEASLNNLREEELQMSRNVIQKYKEALEASEELHPNFFDRLIGSAEIWAPLTGAAFVLGASTN